MTKNYDKLQYTVENRTGFSLSEALRLWKAKYPEYIDFKKDVITHPSLEDFGKFVAELWLDIQPVTVQEALTLSNTEMRRLYFNCIGVQKLFQTLEPKLLDRQVIKKKRTRWDENNDPRVHEFEDLYELYEIDGEKLFGQTRWGGAAGNTVYAVRCWCTTTNREYWLYVPPVAAIGNRWSRGAAEDNPDAIRAIAWTIRIDITNPEKIYRQGDIIVAKQSDNSEEVQAYHLTKEQYLDLMYSET